MKRLCLVVWLTNLVMADLTPTLLRAEEQSLSERIGEVTGSEFYKTAHWGILVAAQDTGRVIYECNADKMFAPASTTKLYSVAAVFDAYGPDHRFETAVFAKGRFSDQGELAGDLILVAGGDLTLGGRTDESGRIAFQDVDHTYANFTLCHQLTAPDPLGGLNELARQIAASGIKRVRGDVLIDDRLFEKVEGTGSGPSNITAIMVNDNVIDLVITPTKTGVPATVTWRPQTDMIKVDAQVQTVPSGADPEIRITAGGDGRVIVRGQITEGGEPVVRVHEVPDPAKFARGLLIESLRRAGVVVDASPLAPSGSLPPLRAGKEENQRRVAMLPSAPFSEEAKLILKVSHNLHASALPLLLAVKHGQRTLEDGLRWQCEFLERAGVDVKSISFADGAGGGRGDFTTPRATVQLLRYMSTRPDFPSYKAALPVLGVDGTLATSVAPESRARGKVQAKTGTLIWENVMNGTFVLTSKALAGYMTTAGGRKLALAIMVNNVPLRKSADTALVGQALGRLCEVIYDDR